MSEKSKRPRRSFSAEFKQDAADLVVRQGYSFKAAADAVGIAAKSLRDWHAKLAPEPEPCGDDASTAAALNEYPCLTTRSTASRLNSALNERRARFVFSDMKVS